ncbi:WD and tetratricopeptide repeats protein 1 isoform 1 [Galdieria sulphuraria]|uniref:WD and tetratricopeptide repeats protein 1 isoform 1 n=1 Tax=Galdieria sulphuraria TaxID=130081 RepID=M2XUM7_GALSU|nr:WD and tetratricopeptide repeats protein 1 isoform 1 [Galdieria sulphuraria]EME27124.1 WD and tetratricopeptide repeats protein 1 isoform 1 [Galdieria sulphuraria]|eukprot:XP_005703644.1 WD and tetratricopeptide repeats protein 1 isoform 1 [Galdieria sulphuraria]
MSLLPCVTSLSALIDYRERFVCKRNYWELDNILSHSSFFQKLENIATLKGHSGCVNRLSFNEEGSLLLSGSDDCRLLVWDVAEGTLRDQVETGHDRNIFGVRFIPCTNDRLLASGAMDCTVRVSSLDGRPEKLFEVHEDRVKTIDVERRNPNLIFSASEDGRVYQIDLRTPEDPVKVVEISRTMVKSAMLNPNFPFELVVSCNDPYIYVYDRRMSFDRPKANYCPSHLRYERLPFSTFSCFNESGTAIAASYCYEGIYVFSTQNITSLETVEEQFNFAPERQQSPTLRNLRRVFHDLLLAYEYFNKDQFGKALIWISKACDIYYWNQLMLCRWILYCLRGWPGDIDAAFPDLKNLREQKNSNVTDQPALLISPHIVFPFCWGLLDLRYILQHLKFARSVSSDMEENVNDILKRVQDQQTKFVTELDELEETFPLERWWSTIGIRLTRDTLLLTKQHVYDFMHYWIGIMMHKLYSLSQKLRKEVAELLQDASIRRREEEREETLVQSVHTSMLTMKESVVYSTLPSLRDRSSRLCYHRRFLGHLSVNTDIKEVNFISGKYPCVLSGSDDGHFYVWSLDSGMLLGSYKADSDAVNCVLPHPYQPLIATSGIESNIKLWSPSACHNNIDEDEMEKLMQSNVDKLNEIRGRPQDIVGTQVIFPSNAWQYFGPRRSAYSIWRRGLYSPLNI